MKSVALCCRFPEVLIAALPLLVALPLSLALPVWADTESGSCTLRLSGGWVVDGSGEPGFQGDVILDGERIVAAIDRADPRGTAWGNGLHCAHTRDVRGLVVAPGFINMLSWATESILLDPRALSDVAQGVTLEVMGEGRSMGPFVNPQRANLRASAIDAGVAPQWRTLGDYFGMLRQAGIGVNVASYVGATTIREYVMGRKTRGPNESELAKMRSLVRQAMEEGAMGVGSSLIYTPANYATTDELAALAAEAAQHGGGYISHLRSESQHLLDAVEELIEISERSGARAEIYHLKAAGNANWSKLNQVIDAITTARSRGLEISANMYPYTAAASGLDAAMPPWVQLGGVDLWVERLKDPQVRQKVVAQMRDPHPDWENLLLDGADKARLLGVKTKALRRYVGMTLAEIAAARGVSPEDAAIDLVIADRSKTRIAYSVMSEANLRKKLQLEWVSIGSDASAPAAEGRFLYQSQHPRAYGSFARVLGRYVRDEAVLELEDAVYQITGLPAANLGLTDRGRIAPGYFADLAVFDAGKIIDTSTFAESHSYAKGVQHVYVNGQPVIADGKPTGALPGQIVRGPGWKGSVQTAISQR